MQEVSSTILCGRSGRRKVIRYQKNKGWKCISINLSLSLLSAILAHTLSAHFDFQSTWQAENGYITVLCLYVTMEAIWTDIHSANFSLFVCCCFFFSEKEQQNHVIQSLPLGPINVTSVS